MRLIAHRGITNDEFMENTMSSIKEGFNSLNTIGVEVDIRKTKDNKLVICHDFITTRTSNSNFIIENTPLNELKKYNFGTNTNYDTIPTLFGTLKSIDTNKIFLLEIKDDSVVDYLIEVLRLNFDKNIYVMVNDVKSFNKLYKLNNFNNVKIGMIFFTSPSIDIFTNRPNFIAVNSKFVSKKLEIDCFNEHIELFVFNVDSDKEKEKFKANYIITDNVK